MVASFFVNDAHEFHPGVVLRVAPHATGLPHGDGAGDFDTSSTPLLGVEGTVVSRSVELS